MEGKTNYSQVYILLIVLLVLSQDDVNNETIQKIVRFIKLFKKGRENSWTNRMKKKF